MHDIWCTGFDNCVLTASDLWYFDFCCCCLLSALEKHAQSIEEQCAKEKVSEIICDVQLLSTFHLPKKFLHRSVYVEKIFGY